MTNNTLAVKRNIMTWFDDEYKMEREELADLEYLDPLVPIEGEEIDMLEESSEELCYCSVNPTECLVHNKDDNESIND